MSKTFDPDKHFVKIRGMNGVRYHQNGCEFNSGYAYIGKLKADDKPATDPVAEKKDVRAAARAKINKRKDKNKGNLDGFREGEAPEAVTLANKENATALQAEENA